MTSPRASTLRSRQPTFPRAVRAWVAGDTGPGRKVWSTLADLGVTALVVPERFDGIDAHPVDLVVAAERLGYWASPARSPNQSRWLRCCWLKTSGAVHSRPVS